MIVPMKRLTLVALKEDEERIMQALQSVSAVQIIETEDASLDEPTLSEAEGAVLRLNNALNIIKPYAKKPSMMQPKPETTLAALQSSVPDALTLSEQLEAADHKKAAIRAQIEKNNAQNEQMGPWLALGSKLCDVHESAHTALFCGMLKAEQTPKLSEIPGCTAVEIFSGAKETAVLVLCLKEEQAVVAEFVKSLDWTDVNLPNLELTPAQVIAENEKATRTLQQELTELDTRMLELSVNRAALAEAADAAVIERDRAQAKNLLTKTNAAFALEGWVRADETEKVYAAAQSVTEACFLEFREPDETEIPPSVVQNSSKISQYEAVTNLYSRPAPGSIDGTPFMAPWYFLLFGMMLSDTGYGIVLFLACLLFIKKAKPTGMTGSLAKVIMLGGLSTIVWGFLVGTFFGMDWNVLLYGTAQGPFPLIVNPNTNPINMLMLCFGLGVLHIFFGVGVKMYMCFRDGDWQSAIFDNFSWVLIVFGLILFAALPAIKTVGMVMAIVGAAMVLFMKGRSKKKVVSRAVSGLAGLYDVTSYLSDILSYARLFALGIATGVIGSVFNQLAGMIMNASTNPIMRILLLLVGIALLVALHVFNIGINTLGTFVHCARLQYVEFYGKFYEVGGREFKPLGYKTRHTKVTQS